MENTDIVTNFLERWDRNKDRDVVYEDGTNWFSMMEAGVHLMTEFPLSYSEQELTPVVNESHLIYPGQRDIARPDLIAAHPRKGTVIVDFKAGRAWTQDDIDDSSQLTKYALAVYETLKPPLPINVGVCNLIYKERAIRWLYSHRTEDQMSAYSEREPNYFPLF
jgi:hypothetical protein